MFIKHELPYAPLASHPIPLIPLGPSPDSHTRMLRSAFSFFHHWHAYFNDINPCTETIITYFNNYYISIFTTKIHVTKIHTCLNISWNSQNIYKNFLAGEKQMPKQIHSISGYQSTRIHVTFGIRQKFHTRWQIQPPDHTLDKQKP